MRCTRQILLCGVLSMVAASSARGVEPDTCALAAVHGSLTIQVDRLSGPDRCQLSAVVNAATTFGTIGPTRTPIELEVYTFLLDHPALAASLVRHLGIANYRIAAQQPNVWSADDGEGTQGTVTLALEEPTRRVYALTGFHDSGLVGRVFAKAVVFMEVRPEEDRRAVDTQLAVYTQLDERHVFLRTLLQLIRPLAEGTVSRIVAKAFQVADQLGARLAADPEAILTAVASLPSAQSEDIEALTSLVKTRQMFVPSSP